MGGNDQQNAEGLGSKECGRGLGGPDLLSVGRDAVEPFGSGKDRATESRPTKKSGKPDRRVVSAEEFRRAHPAFSFQLDFIKRQEGIRCLERQWPGRFFNDAGAKNFELSFLACFIAQNCERARPRIKRTNLALNQSSRF